MGVHVFGKMVKLLNKSIFLFWSHVLTEPFRSFDKIICDIFYHCFVIAQVCTLARDLNIGMVDNEFKTYP